MKKIIVCLLIAIGFSANAQLYKGKLHEHKINSSAFEKEREIVVYTPPSYDETKDDYPVIYLFDGQFQAYIDMTSGVMDFLAQMGEFSEFIIVGIVTEYRAKEFTPKPLTKKTTKAWGETEVGKAHILEAHLKNEVFPLVEKTYRTKPLRLAIGHSLGGTFVLNAILSDPNMFRGVIAVSPNVSYDYRQLVKTYDDFLKDNETLNNFIYVTVGNVGDMENGFRISMEKLDAVIKYHNPKGLKYTFEVYDGQNHSQTPASTLPKAFSKFHSIFSVPESKVEDILKSEDKDIVTELKTHYKNLSDWLGYESKPTANEVNGFGYTCIYEEKFEDAVKTFEWGNQLYPKDANLYDSRGEALEKMGKTKEAKASYKMALNVLKENKADYSQDSYDYSYSVFKKNFDRL